MERQLESTPPLLWQPDPQLVAKDLGALPAEMGKVSWSAQYTQIIAELSDTDNSKSNILILEMKTLVWVEGLAQVCPKT